MSITRADVADLREGDVVEVVGPRGMSVRGPLTSHGANSLVIGPVVNSGSWTVRTSAGDSGGLFADWILTVISRAPRRLYVNSGKTEPDPGDVVRSQHWTYVYTDRPQWVGSPTAGRLSNWVGVHSLCHDAGPYYDKNLRLLVDGRTGLPPVQS